MIPSPDAPRNAACRLALRIDPPLSSKREARNDRSTSAASGAPAGMLCSQIALRSASSGIVNSMRMCRRRRNASSMFF